MVTANSHCWLYWYHPCLGLAKVIHTTKYANVTLALKWLIKLTLLINSILFSLFKHNNNLLCNIVPHFTWTINVFIKLCNNKKKKTSNMVRCFSQSSQCTYHWTNHLVQCYFSVLYRFIQNTTQGNPRPFKLIQCYLR